MFKPRSGLSILEVIIVVALVVVMATWFYVSTKPTKRLGEAADIQRQYDVESIEKAIKLVATDSGSLSSVLTSLEDSTPYMIVKAGGSTAGTYTCTATGTDIDKVDISTAISSIMPNLPVDPDLTDASNDTGYYLVKNGNSYNIDTCESYQLDATIGDKQSCGDGYCGSTESCSTCTIDCGVCAPSAVCGNESVEGTEVCDDGNTTTETQTCGNGTQENGNYCNADCTQEIVLTEACDDNDLVNEGCGNGLVETAGSSYCNSTCSAYITISVSEICDYTGGECGAGLPGYPHTSPIGCGKKTLCSDDCSGCSDLCLSP